MILGFVLPLIAFANGGLPTRISDDGEFGFQVTVKDLRKNVSICSGVLIAPRVALAPAGCVIERDYVKISAGSALSSKQNVTATSTDIIVRGNINASRNDIAIIKLSDPFPIGPLIRTAKVPVGGTPLVEKATLTGWDRIELNTSLKVWDDYAVWKDCSQRFNLSQDLDPEEFCGEFVPGVEEGSLVAHDGVVYGMLASTESKSRIHRFVEISMHANWIKSSLGEDGTSVNWLVGTKGEAVSGGPFWAIVSCTLLIKYAAQVRLIG